MAEASRSGYRQKKKKNLADFFLSAKFWRSTFASSGPVLLTITSLLKGCYTLTFLQKESADHAYTCHVLLNDEIPILGLRQEII